MDSLSFPCQFTVERSSIRQIRTNPKWAHPNFVKLQRSCKNSIYLPTNGCLATGNGRLDPQTNGVGDKDGVIIVDHGSRRKESNLMLNEFVTMFRDKTGYLIVEPAHMGAWYDNSKNVYNWILSSCGIFFFADGGQIPSGADYNWKFLGWSSWIEETDQKYLFLELAEPSIKNAFSSCVQQGANRVIVSPFFLFPGRHWHQDIPSLTAEAAREHPGVSYVVTAPLGLHGLLVDVVNDRIKHCLSHVAGDEDECAVCAGTGKCRVHP